MKRAIILATCAAALAITPVFAETYGSLPSPGPVTPPSTGVAPGFFNGSGNSTSTFSITTIGNIQLGLKADTAFVPPTLTADPATFNYTASTATVTRNCGASCTGTYQASNWDYYFSINTNFDNSGTLLNSANYGYLLTLTDLTNGQSVSYNPLGIPDNSYYGSTDGVNKSGYNASKDYIAQNAENLAFGTVGFGSDFNSVELPTDVYQITLQVLDKTNNNAVLAEDLITVNAPEPGTWVMMLGSLGAVAFMARRRRA